MSKSTVFFKISDIIFHLPRNYHRYKEVKIEKNFVYDDRYGKYTRADLMYVDGDTPRPVFVYVHGGGFVKGDKRHRSTICQFFATKGYFVYNINYRLAPQYVYPAGTADVVNAANALLSLKDKYNLDLDNITISGDSAGGYYALAAVICSLNKQYADGVGAPQCKVKFSRFVGFCGAYDLEKVITKKTPLDVAVDVAHCLIGEKISGVEDLKKNALYPYINLIDYADGKLPECFLMYSTHDDFCGGQAETLRDKLRSLGVKVEEYAATGEKEGHCFHLLPYKPGSKKCMAAVGSYLEKAAKRQ